MHEDVFYERVGKVIDESQRDGYARLLAAWQANNVQRFRASVELGAEMLAEPRATARRLSRKARRACSSRR